MAYRDEHEALRARLDATQERLRVAEEELVDAKRQIGQPPVGGSPPFASPAQHRRRLRSERADGRSWELVFASISLLLGASLFRLGVISGAWAVVSFVSSLAAMGLLSWWMRGAPRRLLRALEKVEDEAATKSPPTRTRVDAEVARDDVGDQDSSVTGEESDAPPSPRRSRNI